MQKRRHWLRWIIVSLVSVGVVALSIFAINIGAIGTIRRQIFLPSCGDGPHFAITPIKIQDFKELVPLGNVSPPDHTLPTDHLYLYFDSNIANSPLVAPGQIVVTNLQYSSETINGQQPHPGDYSITFTSCNGVSFYVSHIKSLTGKLASQVASLSKSCDRRTPAQGEETINCHQATDITLSAGQPMGEIGAHGNAQAIDFGALKNDVDYAAAGSADPQFDGTNAVCPLDYFNAPAQAALYSLDQRTSQPRCGQIDQDIKGTIQGNWSSESNSNQAKNNWNSHLSIVHYNKQPQFGIIGIGGTISSPQGLAFTPQSSGLTNLEPSQTQPNTLYCYQNEPNLGVPITSPSTPQRLLIKLNSDTQLALELQSGDCSSNLHFNHPTTYYR